MRRARAWPAALALAITLPAEVGAQRDAAYADPDSRATHQAAVRALPGKRLPIVARTRPIVGVSRGLEAVLEELNARVTPQEIRIDLSADVLFDFDKADLKPAAAEELGKVATVAHAHPDAPVTIEGHTDAKGADGYNQRLSERRAESVGAWLARNAGIAAGRMTTRGWGETRPVAANAHPNGSDDPEGRQRNRRVEITLRTGSS